VVKSLKRIFTMNEMHNALRKIRVFHDLKQHELASKLEVSRSHLSEIENGRKGFSIEYLKRFAKLFNYKLFSLIAFAEWLETKDEKAYEVASFDPELRAMINIIRITAD
jgi:transcriptional regulator with XRE-family HTH domain